MNNYLTFFIFTLLFSCATPSDMLEKQEYDRAYQVSLRQLKSGKVKNAEINREVLNIALEKSADKQLQKISSLENSNNEKDWEKALKNNQRLQKQFEASLPFANDITRKKYFELKERERMFKETIADFFETRGFEHLQRFEDTELKSSAQAAYQDFKKTKEYAPHRIALDSFVDLSFQLGIVNYYVEAAPVLVFELSNWEVDRVFESIEDNAGGFRRIFFERPMDAIDCSINIEIRDLDFDLDESKETESFEEQVQDGYDIEIDTAGQEIKTPKFITVKGYVTTTTFLKEGKLEARVSIGSQSKNCGFSDSNFTAEYVSKALTRTEEGDERAIPSSFSGFDAEELEDDDDMIQIMLENLFEQVADYYF